MPIWRNATPSRIIARLAISSGASGAMTDRTPLPEQLATIERLLARAKAEQDWLAIPSLKATAALIRWTMAKRRRLW
jgi:hypothetical protein